MPAIEIQYPLGCFASSQETSTEVKISCPLTECPVRNLIVPKIAGEEFITPSSLAKLCLHAPQTNPKH